MKGDVTCVGVSWHLVLSHALTCVLRSRQREGLVIATKKRRRRRRRKESRFADWASKGKHGRTGAQHSFQTNRHRRPLPRLCSAAHNSDPILQSASHRLMVLKMPPKLVYRVGEHIGAHGSRTQPVRTASSPKKPGGSPVRPLDPAASSSSSSTGTRALFQGPVAADLAAMQPPEPEPAWESDADEEDEAAAEEGEEEEEADAAEHRSRITKRGSMLTSSSRRSLATLESGSAKQNGKRIREELAGAAAVWCYIVSHTNRKKQTSHHRNGPCARRSRRPPLPTVWSLDTTPSL